MKIDYVVTRGFWHNNEWIAPAAEGATPRTLRLTEREARYYVLDGALTAPTQAGA
jgi:hypothetical protein